MAIVNLPGENTSARARNERDDERNARVCIKGGSERGNEMRLRDKAAQTCPLARFFIPHKISIPLALSFYLFHACAHFGKCFEETRVRQLTGTEGHISLYNFDGYAMDLVSNIPKIKNTSMHVFLFNIRVTSLTKINNNSFFKIDPEDDSK